MVQKVHNGLAERAKVAESSEKEYSNAGWQKDWYLPEAPDVIPMDPNQRLVVIGDIHGNLDHLISSLVAGKIIEAVPRDVYTIESYIWSAGDTVCVQLGDVLDRGFHEEICLRILLHLARQARKSGGYLILLYGNHEFSNMICDTRYCMFWKNQSAFVETFEQIIKRWLNVSGGVTDNRYLEFRRALFSPGGPLAGPFLSKLKVAVKVGSTILAHGGIEYAEFKDEDNNPDDEWLFARNQSASEWISNAANCPYRATGGGWAVTPLKPSNGPSGCPVSGDIVGKKFFCYDDCAISTLPSSLVGNILWSRRYSKSLDRDLSLEDAKDLDLVLKRMNVKRMVVGHTHQDAMNSIQGGKVWRIDVSHEEADCPGRPGQALEIILDRLSGMDVVNVLQSHGCECQTRRGLRHPSMNKSQDDEDPIVFVD